MKTTKTIFIASSSMLAAGMAQGAVDYSGPVNLATTAGGSDVYFDLNPTDGNTPGDFEVFFDGANNNKPCVLGSQSESNPTPFVFNEEIMQPLNSTNENDNNGVPVIPFGTTITTQIIVGTNTLALTTDVHNKNEGYLYQNGETDQVGQWPLNSVDTFGYVALAMVNTNVIPATTNYGWVQLELNGASSPGADVLTVIDYAYEDISGSNILAGQEGPIAIPAIYQAPTNQTVAAGQTVNMSVVAMGNPSPTYQWMAGGIGSGIYTNVPNAGVFSGANMSILTISDTTPANQLDYVVVAANANGSVTSSPPATLTVLGASLEGPMPSQQIIYAGHPAQFYVIDNGGVTTTNTWLLSGTNLLNSSVFSDVTTTDLLISSVQPGNLGNYQAIASTAYGSVTSSVAPLGIVYTDGTLYESNVLADAAVDYYRLDETSGSIAYDFIGGNNGIYGSDAVLGEGGPTAAYGFPGLASTNYCATFVNNDANNLLPCSPWNLNTNTVTITAWINPIGDQYVQGNEGNAGIVFTSGTNDMVCGIRYDAGYTSNNLTGTGDIFGEGSIGYNWNNTVGSGLWNSGITAPENQWSMIALAVGPTNATLYIMNTNGVAIATNYTTAAVLAFNATEYIGTWPSGVPGANNFIGNIDEVAVFNSTLSQSQITTLYNSALGQEPLSPIIISQAGGKNLQLQWSGGLLLQATNIMGPWTTNVAATSPYIVSPTNAQEYFRTVQ